MIKIFNSTDKNFNSNGNIAIEPLKCIEKKSKSLNGWSLSIEVSLKYKDYIKKDNLVVIKTKSVLNPQAFRISNDIQYNLRTIVFTADHVSNDSENYFLLDVRPTKLNATAALTYVNERTDNKSPFFVNSDITTLSTAYFINKNLKEAWAIFEERYNGYFQFDNWNVSLKQNIGKDTNIIIAYSQKLQGMQIFEDWSNVVTRIYPTGSNGIMLDEKFLDSDVQYEMPYTRTISFNTNLELEEQTEENLKQELKENALKYLEENKYPKISYEITSDINQDLEIGDKVIIKHPLIDIKIEVQEYTYDHVEKKINSIVFGNFVRDVKMKFNTIKQSINNQFEIITSQGKLIQDQTNKINMLNKNGIVYIDDNEILILDKTPKSEAKNVWKWGLGGFAFSSNGYEGPFETAIDQEGRINANFILSGKIQTNMIEGYDELVTKVSSTDINLNNNYYNKEQIDANQKSFDEDLSFVKNTVEQIQTSYDVKFNIINETLLNGITSVRTETGYVFDKEGLNISKSGEEMKFLADNTGVYVDRDEENVLTANNEGVIAENLKARKYIITSDIFRQEKVESHSTPGVYGLGFFNIGEE